MNFENQSAGEVTATVELYHRVDVVFPKGVFGTEVDGTRVIFCHEVEMVDGFGERLVDGKSETKVCTKGGTVKRIIFAFIVDVG